MLRRINTRTGRRLAALLVAVSVPAAAIAPAAGQTPPAWSIAKVMRMIDGARVRVGSRAVRVDADTTLCSGIGPGIRVSGVRRWASFRCTYSAFLARGIYDCSFRVDVRGRSTYAIRNARWTAGAP